MRCFTRRDRQRIARKLKAAFAGLVGGFAFACSGPTQPGEMPPLAPRPEPMQPTPSSPEPVPGAPDPIDPTPGPTVPPADGGVPMTEIEPPQFRSARPRQADDAGVVDDGGTAGDAAAPPEPPEPAPPADASVPLPPIPDALPADANKRPE